MDTRDAGYMCTHDMEFTSFSNAWGKRFPRGRSWNHLKSPRGCCMTIFYRAQRAAMWELLPRTAFNSTCTLHTFAYLCTLLSLSLFVVEFWLKVVPSARMVCFASSSMPSSDTKVSLVAVMRRLCFMCQCNWEMKSNWSATEVCALYISKCKPTVQDCETYPFKTLEYLWSKPQLQRNELNTGQWLKELKGSWTHFKAFKTFPGISRHCRWTPLTSVGYGPALHLAWFKGILFLAILSNAHISQLHTGHRAICCVHRGISRKTCQRHPDEHLILAPRNVGKY